MGHEGFEPSANGLKVRCSTIELITLAAGGRIRTLQPSACVTHTLGSTYVVFHLYKLRFLGLHLYKFPTVLLTLHQLSYPRLKSPQITLLV